MMSTALKMMMRGRVSTGETSHSSDRRRALLARHSYGGIFSRGAVGNDKFVTSGFIEQAG
jgi:hypothetical protein